MMNTVFQSPPSVRKATMFLENGYLDINISIPAFREEGDADCPDRRYHRPISIPAFREEGDDAGG